MARIGVACDKDTIIRVCIFVYEGISVLEYALAYGAFANANLVEGPRYKIDVVSEDIPPVHGTIGVTLQSKNDLSYINNADIVIVPGWRDTEGEISDTLKTAISAAYKRGVRIAAIGKGVFVLGNCGLLAGRKVGCSPQDASILRKRYSNVFIVPDILFVDGGAILTSAGSVAGLDMCLNIIRKDLGGIVAQNTARVLSVSAHRDGRQSRFVDPTTNDIYKGEVEKLMDQIRENLEADWSMDRMANLCGMSTRTLQRKFKAEVGVNPHAWLTAERISIARDLLVTTDLKLEKIANLTGMKTTETLRHHFKKNMNTSPKRYRIEHGITVRYSGSRKKSRKPSPN